MALDFRAQGVGQLPHLKQDYLFSIRPADSTIRITYCGRLAPGSSRRVSRALQLALPAFRDTDEHLDLLVTAQAGPERDFVGMTEAPHTEIAIIEYTDIDTR